MTGWGHADCRSNQQMRLCAQPELLYVDQTNSTTNPIFLTPIFLTSHNALGAGELYHCHKWLGSICRDEVR
jgi:hypothetical protein